MLRRKRSALAKYGFNTDQGTQFTSEAFLSVLEAKNIKISMTGGRKSEVYPSGETESGVGLR